jgi:hypothetical protein
MYWADGADTGVQGRIQRANLDGSNVETLVVAALGPMGDIALDLSRAKIYWIEFFPARIRRANLDGSTPENVLVATGTAIQGLGIDPLMGHMFWGEQGSMPGFGVIRRANLDGSAPRTLRNFFPTSISVDQVGRKLYFAQLPFEFGSAEVARMNLDGTGPQLIVGSGAGTPSGVGIDFEETPLRATGLAIENPSAGVDAYLEVMPTVPEFSHVSPVPSVPGAVKDIAEDPVTGLLYTVDLTPGPTGQRLYRRDPGGAWNPLPSPTGIAAPGFLWGLAFDESGALHGGGRGVYSIDKHTGQAALLAGSTMVPAVVFGMTSSPTGTGFLSTGLLIVPGRTIPYVGLHAPDGAFLPGAVFPTVDASGEGRLLFDIARAADDNLLYGVAWPPDAAASLDAASARRLAQRAAETDMRSDLVFVNVVPLGGSSVAILTAGAPLQGIVFGLGEN